MFAKILIKAEIEVKTGMHIGTGGEFAAIGAVDSPVVRDPMTNLPIIPGSSLNGKLRSVLVRKYCPAAGKPDNDTEEIKRLFGSMKKSSRLLFNDMQLMNWKELKDKNVSSSTEVKFENTINRLTSVANPRQIERVIPGTKFVAEIIYTIDDNISEAEIGEDMSLFAEGIKLLEYDYIGGHGSRGYGRIQINSIKAESVTEDGSEAADTANRIFEERKI